MAVSVFTASNIPARNIIHGGDEDEETLFIDHGGQLHEIFDDLS
jgi:hypothetical protein